MKHLFEVFVTSLVIICSINVKVVLSQFLYGNRGGFANSYSSHPLGTSLNFQSMKDWHHHVGSGGVAFGNDDWPNIKYPAKSLKRNDRNTGMMNFDEHQSIFSNFDINKSPLIPSSHESELPKTTTEESTSRTTKLSKSLITTLMPKNDIPIVPSTTLRSTKAKISLSAVAKAHIFLLKLIGKSDILDEDKKF